jgi:hypothetical protein
MIPLQLGLSALTAILIVCGCLLYGEVEGTVTAQAWHTLCDTLSMDPPITLAIAKAVAMDHNAGISQTVSSIYGPGISVGLATYGSPNIYDYAAYAFAINTAYAVRNHYHIHFHEEGTFNDGKKMDDVRWSKVKILMEALDPDRGWARDLDYVAWIDADFVFMNFTLRLEQVAAALGKPKADVVASAGEFAAVLTLSVLG